MIAALLVACVASSCGSEGDVRAVLPLTPTPGGALEAAAPTPTPIPDE